MLTVPEVAVQREARIVLEGVGVYGNTMLVLDWLKSRGMKPEDIPGFMRTVLENAIEEFKNETTV